MWGGRLCSPAYHRWHSRVRAGVRVWRSLPGTDCMTEEDFMRLLLDPKSNGWRDSAALSLHQVCVLGRGSPVRPGPCFVISRSRAVSILRVSSVYPVCRGVLERLIAIGRAGTRPWSPPPLDPDFIVGKNEMYKRKC